MRGMACRAAVILLAASAVLGIAGVPGVAGLCGPRTISVGDSTVQESEGLMNFTVFTSGCAAGVAQFEVVAGAGGFAAATPGVDYLSTSGQITWAAGQLGNKMISVGILGDNITEQDEGLTITLKMPVGLSILDGTGQGVILDDDGPNYDLDLTALSRPFCGLEVCVSCSMQIDIDRRVPFDVTVLLETHSATAIAETDFKDIGRRVTIPAGMTQVRVPISILDDFVPEPTETFIVSISQPSVGQIRNGQVVIVITDDD